jgi:hypothetical protein
MLKYLCNFTPSNNNNMTTITTISEANTLIENILSVKDLKNITFNFENRKLLSDLCNQEFSNLINLYGLKEITISDIYNSLDELQNKINN